MTKNEMTKLINSAFKFCDGIKFCTQDNKKGRSAKRGLADIIIILEKPRLLFIWWEIKTDNDKPSHEQIVAMRLMKILSNISPYFEADYITKENIEEKIKLMV